MIESLFFIKTKDGLPMKKFTLALLVLSFLAACTSEKQLKEQIRKIIKDYGCCLLALQWDDETIIEECAATKHKKYHDPEVGYSIELNF